MAMPSSDVYIFKVAPDYTRADYYTVTDHVSLDEWTGKPWEQFHAGMLRKGYAEPDVKRYTLPHRGEFTEYTYNRKRSR